MKIRTNKEELPPVTIIFTPKECMLLRAFVGELSLSFVQDMVPEEQNAITLDRMFDKMFNFFEDNGYE